MSVLDKRQPIRSNTPSLILMSPSRMSRKSLDETNRGTIQRDCSYHLESLRSQTSGPTLRGIEVEKVIDIVKNRFKDFGYPASGQQESSELIFTNKWSEFIEQSSMHSDLSGVTDSLVKLDSFDSEPAVTTLEETKMEALLMTYLEQCQTIRPIVVMRKKQRKNIFAAIRKYYNNGNIARLAVNLLDLLAEKTDKKSVFSEIMQNFGNIAALVSAHKTDVNFAQDFMSIVVHIISKHKTALSQLDDLAYKETFLEIKEQHVSNKCIQDFFKIISSHLEIKKRETIETKVQPRGNNVFALGEQRLRILKAVPGAKLALNLVESNVNSFHVKKFCPSNSNWYSNIPEAESCNGDSIEGTENVESYKAEFDNDMPDKWEGEIIVNVDGDLVSWGSESDDSDSSVKYVKSMTPGKEKTYTAHRVKQLQIENAQREQTLLTYKEAVAAQGQDILKLKSEQSNHEKNRDSVIAVMVNIEKKTEEEIAKLRRQNVMLKATETHFSGQAKTFIGEKDKAEAEKKGWDRQYEKLKAMATQQMNQAKAHYIGIRQRISNDRVELTNLQRKMEDTVKKIAATQDEQKKMVKEYNKLYQTFQLKQKECQESRKKATQIENYYNSFRVNLSSKVAITHQALVKGKGDIRLAYQMQGSFKANIKELKIERADLLKKLQAIQNLNSECFQIDNQLKILKKENIDLKERLADLQEKDVSEKDFTKLQALNKKLKKETAELKLMKDELSRRQRYSY